MVQAFHVLAQMPVLPLRPHDKIDIVPANYVGKSDREIHKKEAPVHGIYHLSSGTGSQTYHELTDAISQAGGMLKPMFLPSLGGPFSSTVNWVAESQRRSGLRRLTAESLLAIPRLNTVFDNSRVVAELGEAPAKFSTYAYPLLRFSRDNKFRYPAKPWPSDASAEKIAVSGRIGA